MSREQKEKSHATAWVIAFVLAVNASGLVAQTTSEKEPKRFMELDYDERVKALADEAVKHFEKWKSSRGDERQHETYLTYYYAWHGEKREMIDHLISDDKLAETEVKVSDKAEVVAVSVKYAVETEHNPTGWSSVVWRRITKSRFEVWTPHEGRLFDADGALLATAHPTRDNSRGREWFGAFLPDGRWITTELHETDGRVYIFDRKGRCTHEIKAGALLENDADKIRQAKPDIIPWARSTKDGDAWLVRIGSEEGRGECLLEPDGTWRRTKKTESIWQLCFKRQLGVRLYAGHCQFINKSDDGKLTMLSQQPAHGPDCGNVSYDVLGASNESGPPRPGNIPSDGNTFGFWPDSRATFVYDGTRTWLFDLKSRYAGWIAGDRVGDSGKSILFRTDDGRCATITPDLHATVVQRFQLPDGQVLRPLELQADIGLGIFANKNDRIFLASWPVKRK